MTALLPVTTDLAALERFAYQLFSRAAEETSRPAKQASRLQAAALNPARLQKASQRLEEEQGLPRAKLALLVPSKGEGSLVEGSRGARSAIPLAYQLWLAHLLWLEDVLHTLDCRPADVTAAELAGLQALGRARARFLRTHQFCPHCDAANPRLPRVGATHTPAARCRRCHQEL